MSKAVSRAITFICVLLMLSLVASGADLFANNLEVVCEPPQMVKVSVLPGGGNSIVAERRYSSTQDEAGESSEDEKATSADDSSEKLMKVVGFTGIGIILIGVVLCGC